MFDLTKISCGSCGIEFAVPTCFYNEKQKEGPRQSWFCPNGHERHFAESQVDKMRRERDRAVQEQARLSELVASKEREVTRLKKRSASGTCSCCNRTFANMARHMKTKHPEMLGDNVTKLKKKA